MRARVHVPSGHERKKVTPSRVVRRPGPLTFIHSHNFHTVTPNKIARRTSNTLITPRTRRKFLGFTHSLHPSRWSMAIYGGPVTPHAGREIRGSWPGPCGFRGGSSRGVIMGPRGPRASGVRNNMVYATPCTAAYWSGLASRLLLTPAIILWLTGRRGRVRGAGLEAGTVVRNTQYAIRKPCQTVLRNTQKAASIRTLNTQSSGQ